jgi:hypothetical protein
MSSVTVVIPPGYVVVRELILWGLLGGFLTASVILFLSFISLVTNREAFFWWVRRFSSKLAVAEFDDSGRVEFKAENSIGQGVVKKKEKFGYSMIPRNISKNLGAYVAEETSTRYNLALVAIYNNTPKDAPLAVPPTLFNEIRNQVVTEIQTTSQDVLEVAEHLNNFRCFTAGTKTPFFLRYSGKAILVNPIVGVVASQDKNATIAVANPTGEKDPKTGTRALMYARVSDLKTFFTRMITPSQISYIAQRSEMIGAKLIGEDGGGIFKLIIIVAGVLLLLVVGIYYGLPALGIKLG